MGAWPLSVSRTASISCETLDRSLSPALVFSPVKCRLLFSTGLLGDHPSQWVRCRTHFYVGLGGWSTQAGSCLEPHPISRLSGHPSGHPERDSFGSLAVGGAPSAGHWRKCLLDCSFLLPYLLSPHWLNTQYTRTGTTTRRRKAPGAD